ncbi:MAG: hypothetical protein ABSH05_25505 [Bryobacteraceae bacterium]|jgi:hypothetical protein
MRNSWYVWVMAAAFATGALAQKKPDFSGTWKLDLLRSRLDDVPGLKSSVIKIEHHEPKIHIEITTVTHQGETSEAFDLTTDGVESKQTIGGQPCAASAQWDSWSGNRLVLTVKCQPPEGAVVTTRRMKLGDKDRMMTTVLTVKDKTGEKKGYGFYVKEPQPGS